MVVETAQFKTKPGVSDREFLAASKVTHDKYLSKCKGFVSRELLKTEDGTWLDVVHFETMKDAEASAKGFLGNPETKAFEDAIDPASASMNHFTVIEGY